MDPKITLETEGLIEQFFARYGVTKGGQIYRTVMPGILADFQKQALALQPGAATGETYRMEDRSASVQMTAERNLQGEIHIKARLV